MSKYTYTVEFQSGDAWLPVVSGSRDYCLGYIDCRKNEGPRLAHRVIRSDWRIVDHCNARSEVNIGQVAGWPSAEQYESAAARALERAEQIRARTKRANSGSPDRQLNRCRHCGGMAVILVEPAPPPHPHSTHTGDWTPDLKLARVECAACHIQTNSVPEDMTDVVIRRWNS